MSDDAWNEVASKLTAKNAESIPREVVEVPEIRQGWHLLIVPEDDVPVCETFGSTEQLRRALKRYVEKEVRVFVFEGARLFTTEPPYSKLILSDGAVLPLHDTTEALVYRTDGRLYSEEQLPDPSDGVMELAELEAPEGLYEDDEDDEEPDGEEVDGLVEWD